jgi:DNA-binding NtrC family response regulator
MKGTEFVIYFPANERESFSQQEAPDSPEVTGGTETLLLVDDEVAIRDLARAMLTDCGYTVLTADSGERALEAYREHKETISLVVLDLNMPGMGGQKCLQEILRMDPKENVIIVSGYGVGGSTEPTSIPGAKGYVSKPYELKTFLKVVRKVLDQESRP